MTSCIRSFAMRPLGSEGQSRTCLSWCIFHRTADDCLSLLISLRHSMSRTAPPTLLFMSKVFQRWYILFGLGFVPTSSKTTTLGCKSGQKALNSHLCEFNFLASGLNSQHRFKHAIVGNHVLLSFKQKTTWAGTMPFSRPLNLSSGSMESCVVYS